MAESLVLRVKRLMSGSVHGLVDAMEKASSENVMREAIREVDRTIDEVRHELGQVIAARHHANRRIVLSKAKQDELTEKAKFALTQNRDDLAEAALSRQLELEGLVPQFETAMAEAAENQNKLEGLVAQLTERKREMETELASFLAARQAAAEMSGSAPCDQGRRMSAERRVENAQHAFDRAMGHVSGMPGLTKTDRDTAQKLGELDKVSRNVRVAERLAALKTAGGAR